MIQSARPDSAAAPDRGGPGAPGSDRDGAAGLRGGAPGVRAAPGRRDGLRARDDGLSRRRGRPGRSREFARPGSGPTSLVGRAISASPRRRGRWWSPRSGSCSRRPACCWPARSPGARGAARRDVAPTTTTGWRSWTAGSPWPRRWPSADLRAAGRPAASLGELDHAARPDPPVRHLLLRRGAAGRSAGPAADHRGRSRAVAHPAGSARRPRRRDGAADAADPGHADRSGRVRIGGAGDGSASGSSRRSGCDLDLPNPDATSPAPILRNSRERRKADDR